MPSLLFYLVTTEIKIWKITYVCLFLLFSTLFLYILWLILPTYVLFCVNFKGWNICIYWRREIWIMFKLAAHKWWFYIIIGCMVNLRYFCNLKKPNIFWLLYNFITLLLEGIFYKKISMERYPPRVIRDPHGFVWNINWNDRPFEMSSKNTMSILPKCQCSFFLLNYSFKWSAWIIYWDN